VSENDLIETVYHRKTYFCFTRFVLADEFDGYCEDILLPSTWGGQIELLALSKALHHSIHVIQADVDTTVHGEQADGSPIILT